MSLRVLKPFNSVNRRFKAGDELADNEDLSPHTLEGAKAAGLVAAGHVMHKNDAAKVLKDVDN